MTTYSENVDHTRWPCVPHAQGVPCQQAIEAWTATAPGRVLKRQEMIRDRPSKAPR